MEGAGGSFPGFSSAAPAVSQHFLPFTVCSPTGLGQKIIHLHNEDSGDRDESPALGSQRCVDSRSPATLWAAALCVWVGGTGE